MTVSADSARGPISISTLHAPSLVGELGALAQLPRSATARACTAVTALRFGRAALIEAAHATPSLLIDIIGRMGERLRKFNGAISLYTEALEALERHNLDPSLLEELRNPTRTWPISVRPSAGWPNNSFCAVNAMTKWRARRSSSAALLPGVQDFAEESASTFGRR